MASESSRSIETVFRMEQARLIAGLTRLTRDVGQAEELAQDALVVALEKWPPIGIPDNPGAWLMSTAKNRAIDQARRKKLFQQKQGELAQEDRVETDIDAVLLCELSQIGRAH